MQHVFIVGAKGFTYGGYETFLDKLTEYHQNNENIKYHIACKANGPGMTDETKLAGIKKISGSEYIYHNAHCFKIKSPELGSAQAIFYDIKALQYCCKYIKKHNIEHPIVYVLSSRVGPVMGHFEKKSMQWVAYIVTTPTDVRISEKNMRLRLESIGVFLNMEWLSTVIWLFATV